MPRKPRVKKERLRSLMRTGSSAATKCYEAVTPKTECAHNKIARKMTLRSAKTSSKMPALASLIAAALKVDIGASTGAAPTTAVASPTAEAAASSKKNRRPKRRKREMIKLPPSVSLATLSDKELRRLKNRISATRLRERSQQTRCQMEEQLEAYKQRCEFLESVVSGCPACAVLSAVQFGEIELLPADKFCIKKEEASVQEDDPPALTEAECLVLGNVLHC